MNGYDDMTMEQEAQPSEVMPPAGLAQLLQAMQENRAAGQKMLEAYNAPTRPDPTPWFAAAAGFLSPTKTGTFGENLGLAAQGFNPAYQKMLQEEQARKIEAAKMGYGLSKDTLGEQVKLAGLMQKQGAIPTSTLINTYNQLFRAIAPQYDTKRYSSMEEKLADIDAGVKLAMASQFGQPVESIAAALTGRGGLSPTLGVPGFGGAAPTASGVTKVSPDAEMLTIPGQTLAKKAGWEKELEASMRQRGATEPEIIAALTQESAQRGVPARGVVRGETRAPVAQIGAVPVPMGGIPSKQDLKIEEEQQKAAIDVGKAFDVKTAEGIANLTSMDTQAAVAKEKQATSNMVKTLEDAVRGGQELPMGVVANALHEVAPVLSWAGVTPMSSDLMKQAGSVGVLKHYAGQTLTALTQSKAFGAQLSDRDIKILQRVTDPTYQPTQRDALEVAKIMDATVASRGLRSKVLADMMEEPGYKQNPTKVGNIYNRISGVDTPESLRSADYLKGPVFDAYTKAATDRAAARVNKELGGMKATTPEEQASYQNRKQTLQNRYYQQEWIKLLDTAEEKGRPSPTTRVYRDKFMYDYVSQHPEMRPSEALREAVSAWKEYVKRGYAP